MKNVEDTDSQNNSTLIEHTHCNDCSSSDGMGVYDDGHTYCFVCQTHSKGDRAIAITKEKEPVSFLDIGKIKGIKSRGLTEETCKFWGYQVCRMNEVPFHIANFFNNKKEVIGQKIRNAEEKSFSSRGSVSKQLYGQWLWSSGKKLVITEGEIDALSVSQIQDNKYPVVSIPLGATSAKKALQANMGWLKGFSEIILMFDNDEAGQKAAKECVKLFESDKVKIAKLPLKDANEMLLAGRAKEVTQAIWNACEYIPEGVVRVGDIKHLIGKTLEMGDSYPFETLTKLLWGMRAGQITTWTSGTGMGKTEFLKQVVSHLMLEHKKKVGLVFLEEEPKDTVVFLAGKLAGKCFHNPQQEFDIKERDHWINELDKKDLLYMYGDKGEGVGGFGDSNYDRVKENIRYMVNQGCEYIFLDHITVFSDGKAGESNAVTEHIMNDLSRFTRELKFHLHLVSHIRKTDSNKKAAEEGGNIKNDDMKGSTAIKQYSNTVLALQRNQKADDEREARTTKIVVNKSREVGASTGKYLKVLFDPETYQLSEIETGEEPNTEGFVDEGKTDDF